MVIRLVSVGQRENTWSAGGRRESQVKAGVEAVASEESDTYVQLSVSHVMRDGSV